MKKGFTLVELLATILILGIITTIAIYNIKKQTEFAKEEALKESAKEIIKAADNYYADLGYVNFPTNGISIKNLDLKSTGFKSGKVKLINNEYVVVDLTDGKYCINGTKDNLELVKGRCAGPEYVYYASITPVDETGEAPVPITLEDCQTTKPNKDMYLRFEVVGGELQNPSVCTDYFGEEACMENDFEAYKDFPSNLFGYDETWYETDGEFGTEYNKPDDPKYASCRFSEEETYCSNSDIHISIDTMSAFMGYGYYPGFMCFIVSAEGNTYTMCNQDE